MIDHGADCDVQNKYWQTPLHVSALSSDSSTGAFIIEHVTNVDTTDEFGATALHYAVSYWFEQTKFFINFIRFCLVYVW